MYFLDFSQGITFFHQLIEDEDTLKTFLFEATQGNEAFFNHFASQCARIIFSAKNEGKKPEDATEKDIENILRFLYIFLK